MSGGHAAGHRSCRRPRQATLQIKLCLDLLPGDRLARLVHGHVSLGGVFGVLIGVLLIACGVMLCVNPAHRVFYGVAGVVLGILSFPASNLGGFFIGMLLAIIGTLLRHEVVSYQWIAIAFVAGAAVGAPLAYLMPMTSLAAGCCGRVTTTPPGRMMPAFSRAISPTVLPRNF